MGVSIDDLTEGCSIEWTSPIFGLLSGQVVTLPGDGTALVDHPLTKGLPDEVLSSIRIEWVTRILE